jgi:phenylalanyl-tRNA synthetase beta chain
MPIVGVPAELLNRLLKRRFSPDELAGYLEQIGCDVEEATVAVLYRCPRCDASLDRLPQEGAPKACDECGFESEEEFPETGSEETVRIELLPDRPDLFDAGGLARALRGYLGIESGAPAYAAKDSGITVHVDPALSNPESYRPFIACATVTGFPTDAMTVKAVMKLQEDLHWALGRDRKFASIGVYDLDSLEPDIHYRTVGPEELRFEPLAFPETEMTPKEILETHPKGIAYAHLLENQERYPLLVDDKGQVLSMPPIINSEATKVKLDVGNFFIDVTGPNETAVHRSLRVLVTSLAEMGGTIGTVRVRTADREDITPDLSPMAMDLDPEETSRLIGLPLDTKAIEDLLAKMRFGAERSGNGLSVKVPAFRIDVMHPVDIIADVAIGYGYHNLPKSLVPTLTVGRERDIERYCRAARDAMTGLRFQEIVTLTVTCEEDHYERLNLPVSEERVAIENPASVNQTMVRSHLLEVLLDSFRINKTKEMPQRIFEIGDVLRLDPESETGARNVRTIGCGITGPKAGYAEMRSYVEALIRELEAKPVFAPAAHPTFIEGRAASISADGHPVGILGEVHPQVLENFGLVQPAALAEIDLSALFKGD